jgi:serine/threonine protein phosphatase PrpC
MSSGSGGLAPARFFVAPGSMLSVEFAQFSDPGRVRGHNEDYLGEACPETPEQVQSHGWLFALADGVGGQDRGEIASRTAIETVLAGFRDASKGELLTALIPRLAQAANTKVLEAGHAVGPGGSSMATTLVVCALRFDRVVVAHVGDSRCYLIRRGDATCLTRDHTFANEQARLGVLSSKEAAAAPTRHVLSRSLGGSLFVNVETGEHQIFAGDILLLCSDGLHGAVTASDMSRLLGRDADLKASAQALVALANERDGGDNISVQLIRIHSVERVGMYRGRPYKLR